MKDSVLIFDLSGGITDMKKNLWSIVLFARQYGYRFSLHQCTARPQNMDELYQVPHWTPGLDPEYAEAIRNNYMYDVLTLFDEQTFLIYEQYVPYRQLVQEGCQDNDKVFDFGRQFRTDLIFNDPAHKQRLTSIYQQEIVNSDKPFVHMGSHFHFYTTCVDHARYCDKAFNASIIPSARIQAAYDRFIGQLARSEYNFLHYRHESDMRNYVSTFDTFFTPKLDHILNANVFQQSSLPIFLATSMIETLHEKQLLDKPIEAYQGILMYNPCKLLFFDENAFVEYLIGAGATEVVGYSKSGFSIVLVHSHRPQRLNNYYDVPPLKTRIEQQQQQQQQQQEQQQQDS